MAQTHKLFAKVRSAHTIEQHESKVGLDVNVSDTTVASEQTLELTSADAVRNTADVQVAAAIARIANFSLLTVT
jgi:hypothetical protein